MKTKPAKPAPTATKTFDDLRTRTLELVHEQAFQWSDRIMDMLVGWARAASDADVMAWLGYLTDAVAVKTAGLVAVERDRAGQSASAATLLAFAEQKLDAGNRSAVTGLVAARWRLGKTKQAETAFRARVAEVVENRYEGDIAELIAMAALGKHPDEIPKLLAEEAWADDLPAEFGREGLPRAVVGLIADGDLASAHALLDAWTELSPERSSELDAALAGHFAADPAGYFALALAYPTIIDGLEHAPRMLATLARIDPPAAVRVAEKILADDLRGRLDALAVLAAYASDRLGKHAKTKEPDERAAIGKPTTLDEDADEHVASDIASVTTDRALAIAALKVAASRDADPNVRYCVPLVKLGEQAWVNEQLEGRLAEVRKLTPGRRDLPCRELARVAAAIGNVELAYAAAKLPTPAARQYSASAMVDGFARASDFTNALAALELIPNDDSNGRVLTAVQWGIRSAQAGLAEYEVRLTRTT